MPSPVLHLHEEPPRRGVQLIDVERLVPVRELSVPPLEGRDASQKLTLEPPMAFSPDGQWLAAVIEIGVVRVWRVADGKLRHTLKGPATPVSLVEFTPDGAYVVSGYAEASRLMVHDLGTGAPRAVIQGNAEPEEVTRRKYWEVLGEGPVAFHRRTDPVPMAHFPDVLEEDLILRDGLVVARGRTLRDFLYVLRLHDAQGGA